MSRPRPRRSSRSGRPGKGGITGVKEARSGLKKLGRNIMSQGSFWQTVAGMLERRYDRVWFRPGTSLESSGGGPEDRPWPGLTSKGYIAQKRREGRDQKLVYSGNMQLSYFAQIKANQEGVWTGVRDPSRGKLRGLTGLGFKLMMVEKSTRQKVYTMLRENTVKGVRINGGRTHRRSIL